MACKSYLVIFEKLVELLADNKNTAFSAHNQQFLNSKTHLYFVGIDSFEKFRGTWWQINIPYNKHQSPDFNYVADSLRDALRLRPELDTSYWSCSGESANEFAFRTNDWADEPDEMELLVLD